MLKRIKHSEFSVACADTYLKEKSVPTFDKMLASERENTDQNAPLGTSAVDTVDGLRLGSVIAGVGGLIKVVKKGSSSSDSSTTGTSETSGEGYSGPYDAKSTRTDLEATNGAENVTSTTVVQNPRQTVNSDPQKNIEVMHDSYGNKAVRVEYKDPVTGESKVANIAYDSQRGLPVFDGHAKYTTNIKKPNGYENMPSGARKSAEMRAATRDLREKIDSGAINQNDFTPAQLRAINSGKENIPGYTWHHNAQSAPNNMQLLPKDVHDAAKHIGEASLSEGR